MLLSGAEGAKKIFCRAPPSPSTLLPRGDSIYLISFPANTLQAPSRTVSKARRNFCKTLDPETGSGSAQ
jgi:hypothetical protein